MGFTFLSVLLGICVGVSDIEMVNDVMPILMEELILDTMDEHLICLGKMPALLKTNTFNGTNAYDIFKSVVNKIRQKQLRELALLVTSDLTDIDLNGMISLEFKDAKGSDEHFWWFYVALWDSPLQFLSIFSPVYNATTRTIKVDKYIYKNVDDIHIFHAGYDMYVTYRKNAFELNIFIINGNMALNKDAFINDPWDSIYIKFRDYDKEGEFINMIKHWKLSDKQNFVIDGLSCNTQYVCDFNFVKRIKNKFSIQIGRGNSDAIAHVIDVKDITFGSVNGTLNEFLIKRFMFAQEMHVYLIVPQNKLNLIESIKLPTKTHIYHNIWEWNKELYISSLTNTFSLIETDLYLLDFRNFITKNDVTITPAIHNDYDFDMYLDLRGLKYPVNNTSLYFHVHLELKHLQIMVDDDYSCKIKIPFLPTNKILICVKREYLYRVLLLSIQKFDVQITYNNDVNEHLLEQNKQKRLMNTLEFLYSV